MTEQVCHREGCEERAYIFDRDGGLCRPHWDEVEAARRAENERLTQEAGGPWLHLCPRRVEDGAQDRWLTEGRPRETPDTWDIREQMAHGLRARHCSYCGSLHPEDFMEKVREGWIVGPTDKSYKAYLGSSEGSGQETKFYFQHLSEDQMRGFIDLLNASQVHIGYPGRFYVRPFFIARPET